MSVITEDKLQAPGLYPVRPCRDCTTRRAGCHSSCLKYKVSLRNPNRKRRNPYLYSATSAAKKSGYSQMIRARQKVNDDMDYYFKYNHNR